MSFMTHPIMQWDRYWGFTITFEPRAFGTSSGPDALLHPRESKIQRAGPTTLTEHHSNNQHDTAAEENIMGRASASKRLLRAHKPAIDSLPSPAQLAYEGPKVHRQADDADQCPGTA